MRREHERVEGLELVRSESTSECGGEKERRGLEFLTIGIS